MNGKRGSRRGAATIIFTLMLGTVLIPIIGIAVDGSLMYWAKAKLSTAVDSAALAAGRSLNVGLNLTEQIDSATTTGYAYFAANYPTGFLNSTVTGNHPTITITQNGLHTRTITVTASAQVPLYFARIFGQQSATIAVTGQSQRRDANIVLVLDRSNSMNGNGSCATMVSAAKSLVNQFVDGRDRMALVTFQTAANIDYAPSVYFKSGASKLNDVLGQLKCTGFTSSAHGLYLAYYLIRSVINQPGALNVIVFFTDGQPNGVIAQFPVKKKVDNRYDSSNTSSIVSTPVSGCSGTTLEGVIADASNEGTPLNATGYTTAVLDASADAISYDGDPRTISASGCAFPSSDWTRSIYGRKDVANIPTADLFGSSTVDNSYQPLDTFSTGHPYAGLIRPDMPRTVRAASINATDWMARTIRQDDTYGTVIYSIYLQGNDGSPNDPDFLERIANDPRASNFDSSRQPGLSVVASNQSALGAAFLQIASQVLRLSQ